MPQVLTTNALILCPHGGKGASVPSHPLWSVDGGSVLVEGDQGALACPFVACPCVGYTLHSMGLNATRIDGLAVILATDFNQTHTGLPLTIAETHTTLDDSTPAPLAPGQPAPPLSPAAADRTLPAVTALPASLAFTIASGSPPTANVTFTLTAAYPLRWILTLVNEPLGSHLDLTGGAPPALTLIPAGGAWNAPVLTVNMSMTAAFMAALTAGTHHFVMTGVSQRGLSGRYDLVLHVS